MSSQLNTPLGVLSSTPASIPAPDGLHVERIPFPLTKAACKAWHYTGTAPSANGRFFGVWESGRFKGAVIFGSGTARLMPAKYGLEPQQCFELTRVALDEHDAPVSQIVARCLKELRRVTPELRLVYSYADPEQGHRGGIYQALNFVYTGKSSPQKELLIDGVPMHKRTAGSKWGTSSVPRLREITRRRVEYGPVRWKHTYLLPFCKKVRRQVEAARVPYPKATASDEPTKAEAPASPT